MVGVTPPRKIYLAHPLKDRIYVAKTVQPQLEQLPNVKIINPFHTTPERKKIFTDETISTREAIAKERELLATANLDERNNIVIYEKKLIRESDIVVAILRQASIGVAMEIYYANENHIPVFIGCEKGYDQHPWLNMYGVTFNGIGALIQYLKMILK